MGGCGTLQSRFGQAPGAITVCVCSLLLVLVSVVLGSRYLWQCTVMQVQGLAQAVSL
jgi:hypothetical protein